MNTNQSEAVIGALFSVTVEGVVVEILFEDKTIYEASVTWSGLMHMLRFGFNHE